MTQEQKRIKIAEACGMTGWHEARSLPDYFNDLNAVHELEERLLSGEANYSQRNYYSSILGSITGNDNGRGWKPLSNDDCFLILHATAAQRAEAFGKTLSLW
jgi:hypothetical protein